MEISEDIVNIIISLFDNENCNNYFHYKELIHYCFIYMKKII